VAREQLKAYTENGLLLLWFIFLFSLTPSWSTALNNFTLVASPLVILGLWGYKWLDEYSFKNWLGAGILCFFVATFISQLFTTNLANGINSIRIYHLKYSAIIFSMLFLLRRKRNFFILLAGFLSSFVFTFVCSYLSFQLSQPAFIFANDTPGGIYSRCLSLYNQNKNTFALLFSLYLPVLFGTALYLSERRRYASYGPVALWLIWLASAPLVILTMSLSTILTVPFLLLAMGVVYSIKLKKLKPLLLGLAFIMLTIAPLLWASQGRKVLGRVTDNNPNTIISKNISTLSRRMGLWSEVLKIYSKRPVFGYDLEAELFPIVAGGYPRSHEHSVYLFFLLRSGAIGFAGFIFFSVVVLIFSTRKFLQSDNLFSSIFPVAFVGGFAGFVLIEGIAAQILKWFWIYPCLLGFILNLNLKIQEKSGE
jgi:O-antigen ligase